MIKIKVGTKLWLVPIRYWENLEPEEVTLIEPIEYHNTRQLYVYHTIYGHDVYVPSERCYVDREKAIQSAKLLTQLRELKIEDECEYLTNQSLEPRQFLQEFVSVEREKRGHIYTGYVNYPSHQIHPKTGSVGYLLNNELTVYRTIYEAKKATEDSRRNLCNIVKLHIIPVFPCQEKAIADYENT